MDRSVYLHTYIHTYRHLYCTYIHLCTCIQIHTYIDVDVHFAFLIPLNSLKFCDSLAQDVLKHIKRLDAELMDRPLRERTAIRAVRRDRLAMSTTWGLDVDVDMDKGS